jgi:succinate-semialdehyde dehydrogenase / glutarate-semialdehyde dehydrogenase
MRGRLMSREREVVEACPTELFIGGKWVAAESGKTLAVEDPATGTTLCDVADAAPADGMAALDAAVL